MKIGEAPQLPDELVGVLKEEYQARFRGEKNVTSRPQTDKLVLDYIQGGESLTDLESRIIGIENEVDTYGMQAGAENQQIYLQQKLLLRRILIRAIRQRQQADSEKQAAKIRKKVAFYYISSVSWRIRPRCALRVI